MCRPLYARYACVHTLRLLDSANAPMYRPCAQTGTAECMVDAAGRPVVIEVERLCARCLARQQRWAQEVGKGVKK
jgi:hypothetical protein